MLKAKEVSVKNVAVFLAVSFIVSAGYFISRQQTGVSRSIPVFYGEEITVQKGVVVVPALAAEKAAVTAKVQAAPMPAPNAAPLPIIPPAITFKVLPAYPFSALRKGLEGTVVLSAYIGSGGQPEKVEVRTSSGVAEMDQSAVKAVSQWRFSPAAQGGMALASWFEVPVRFVME